MNRSPFRQRRRLRATSESLSDSPKRVMRRLRDTPLSERLRVIRLVIESYGRRRDEIAWGLGTFRGIVRRDADWMTDVLMEWSGRLSEFISIVGTRPGQDLLLPLPRESMRDCRLRWQSRGYASLFCSSTMDGPPSVAALCHAILSGTHVLLRPSWRDTVTHLAFDALLENGLGH